MNYPSAWGRNSYEQVFNSLWLPRYSCLNLQNFHHYILVCVVGMKDEDYKRKLDAPDELLASILDAAASIKKYEDRLRRTTRELRTRVEK